MNRLKLVTLIAVFSFGGMNISAQDVANAKDSVGILTYSDTANLQLSKIDSLLPDSLKGKQLAPTPNGQHIDAMIKYAKTFLGTPYKYSGTTPSGFDCSGFINYVMGDFGFELTRTSYGLAELGHTVKLSELRPGDLMFFKGRNVNSSTVGHVAMVIEVSEQEIRMIHASTSRGVTIDNFKASSYYIPRFLKAKRLDYGEQKK